MPRQKPVIVCRRLKGLMVENELTVKLLAKKIGISENSLTLKINGHREWWYRETALVTKVLGFSDIAEVFPELHASIKKGA